MVRGAEDRLSVIERDADDFGVRSSPANVDDPLQADLSTASNGVTKMLLALGLFLDKLLEAERTAVGERYPGLSGKAPARAIPLDDEQLAVTRIVERAVRELARERAAVEDALASGQLAGLARRLPGPRRRDHLLHDLARDRRVLLEILAQPLADDALDDALELAVAELGLGLPLELRILHLDRHHGSEALAHVLAAHADLGLGSQALLFGVVGERAGERRAKTDQVRPTLDGVDVVDEGVDGLLVGVVVLERDLDGGPIALPREEDDPRVEHVLVLVQILHELDDPTLVEEIVALPGAPVGELDREAAVEERELAHARGQRVVLELGLGEDLGVGLETGGGSGALARGLSGPRLHRAGGPAEFVALEVDLAVLEDLDLAPLEKRVDHRDAHAVKASRDLVGLGVELASGVERRHHHLERRLLHGGVHVHGNSASVVDHRD